MGIGSDILYESKTRNFILSMMASLAFLTVCIDTFLNEQYAWFGLSLFVLMLSILPAVAYRDTVSAPWEILFIAALPFLHKIAGIQLLSNAAVSYISVSAVALLVVVELEEFTSLRTNAFFAVFLTAVVTVAMAGFWALMRWFSDLYLGTALITSEEHLMWEFTAATAIGIVFGLLFHYYFKRRTDDARGDVK
mgnify:CR=1 FL=1